MKRRSRRFASTVVNRLARRYEVPAVKCVAVALWRDDLDAKLSSTSLRSFAGFLTTRTLPHDTAGIERKRWTRQRPIAEHESVIG